jgi:hypothetical protein
MIAPSLISLFRNSPRPRLGDSIGGYYSIVEEPGLRKLTGSGVLDCHCEIEQFRAIRRAAQSQWDFAPVPDGTRVTVNHEVALHGWIKSAEPVLMPTALGKVEGDLARLKKLPEA